MEIIQISKVMQCRALELKRAGKTIGFVPTMGFLHEGHLSLMKIARQRCDVLVASIFVNPTQFGPNEDLAAYPRDFGRDEALCEEEGVDLLFYPTTMYADDASVWVDEEALSCGLCGASREGHFRGVCTVVAKLFNLVQPDVAVFGEKDAQQLRIIERMVRDLDFPVEIVRGPIVREPDGLALSSRNQYLSRQERKDALGLRRALDRAVALCGAGECRVDVLRQAMAESMSGGKIDYIEFVDDRSLVKVDEVAGDVLVALSVEIGATRLIDNDILHL